MTNNQLCNLIGIIGCLIAFFGMGFVFFGVTSAAWAIAFGIILGWVSQINYD